MAIVYDPHQEVPGNVLVGKAQSIIAGKYRTIFPVDGPFYSDSARLYNQGVELVEGRDYLLTHLYPTSILRTARRAHGAIWLLNDTVSGPITFTAHYIGHGKATPAQITAERSMNAAKLPNKCYWEDVIGVLYFPQVDIKFDRENWVGEQEVMNALAALASKMSSPPPQADPLATSLLPISYSMLAPGHVYDNHGGYDTKEDSPAMIDVEGWGTIQKRNPLRGKQRFSVNLKSTAAANQVGNAVLGVQFQHETASKLAVEVVGANAEIYIIFPGSATKYLLASAVFPKPQLAGGVTVTVDFDTATGVYVCSMATGAGPIVTYTLDFNNPESSIAAIVASSGVKAKFDIGLSMHYNSNPRIGGHTTILAFPGMVLPIIDNVYEMLVEWKDQVDEAFRTSPAINHVTDMSNPHRDSWGWLRALQLNGIATDTALVNGKDQAALAAAINAQLPGLSALSGKLPRKPTSDTTITGSFTTHPGVTSVTGSPTDGVAANVDSVLTIDPGAAMLLSTDKQSLSFLATTGLRLKSGNNVMELLPGSTKATFNGKELLTPLTIGSYLPGGSTAGDGLFYGLSTASTDITGNGIPGVPFVVTWKKPDPAQYTNYALRQLTDVFGYSDALVATPALIAKLDALFTGKLLKSKANINGLSLAFSITLTKTDLGLENVGNVSDVNMPVSTPQATRFAQYAQVGHTHDKTVFGIGNATTVKVGLVKFGGLVDDAGLALGGDHVLKMYDRVESLEESVAGAGVGIAVEIIRYGELGDGVLENQSTYSGYMLTVRPHIYYLKKQYQVPLATFNLSELYPTSYTDGEFYIYVNMKDNAAYYFVSDKRLAESDTITEIGTVESTDEGIVFSEIRSVTRLGDFREMQEHEASIADHIDYSPTAAQAVGGFEPPVQAKNGLSPVPNPLTWNYNQDYGYVNVSASTTRFGVTGSAYRADWDGDDELEWEVEFTNFASAGTKIAWFATADMSLQFRIDPGTRAIEIWAAGSFGGTPAPSTPIKSAILPADYLTKPLKFHVFLDSSFSSDRELRFVCYSNDVQILAATYTPNSPPVTAPGADWEMLLQARATSTIDLPVNPGGVARINFNSLEAGRPVDFSKIAATAQVPGRLGFGDGMWNWRACDANGVQQPNLNVSQHYNKMRFTPHPDAASTYRLLTQLRPIRFDKGDVAMQQLGFTLSATGGDNTLFEIALGIFNDAAGKPHRFSVLVSNSNFITNSGGKLVNLGFAIDYGTPGQVIIGAPKPEVSAAFSWTQLGSMSSVLSVTKTATQFDISIGGLAYSVVFTNDTSVCTVAFAPGPGNSTFTTATHNLVPYLTGKGLTPAELFKSDASRLWGIGGLFDAPALVEFTLVPQSALPVGGGRSSLTTVAGVFEHMSRANCLRVYEETIPTPELGLTPNEIKLAFIKRRVEKDLTGNLFQLSPENVHITLDLPNKRLQAVVYRL